MKKTSKTTLTVLALGMWCGSTGWLVAQETSSGTISGQVTTATANVAATTNAAATAQDNGALPGDSHVRIVRLSDVSGKMALDRMTGNGFEATMQNMPIVQGERLQTTEGYAEVEFEDNSTLRLAPESRVDFSLLVLRSSGAKASTMRVVQGTVYVTTENTKDNEFLLEAGATKITVAPSTHLRLNVNESRTVVSVFSGSAAVLHGEETTTVAKKQSLTLGADQPVMAKKIAEEPFDEWDKQSNDYHQQYSKANTFAGGGNAFGLSDLNYYGNFIDAGGCGQIWQPYLVSSSWSPYANGVWALYPGAGYSWVSPYPWGWLPYHSGAWSFCDGVGWGWQPGGAWSGLNNIVTTGGGMSGPAGMRPVHSPLRAGPALPRPPAAPAGASRASLVLSNATPIVFSKEDKPGNFVFQRNSAGLGVPRGSLGNLNKISNNVERHGSASMPVYVSTRGEAGGSEHGANRGPATIQRGERPTGEHGSSVSPASRGGGFEGSHGAEAGGSRGGGMSAPAGGGGRTGGAPMGSGAPMGGGGSSRGSSPSPK